MVRSAPGAPTLIALLIPIVAIALVRRPPVAATTSGAALYRTYCAACHGKSGRGDGSLASQLATRPSDLTTLAHPNGGSFPFEAVYRVIDGRNPVKSHGAMPAWGEAFGDSGRDADRTKARERLTQLTQFVASIQRVTPLATPAPRSALCAFSSPGFPGRCTETADIREKLSPGDACEEILACLNGAGCIKTYCGATTLRGGWKLDSARAIVAEP
jgi:mono/diheme cytochrome c family protein